MAWRHGRIRALKITKLHFSRARSHKPPRLAFGGGTDATTVGTCWVLLRHVLACCRRFHVSLLQASPCCSPSSALGHHRVALVHGTGKTDAYNDYWRDGESDSSAGPIELHRHQPRFQLYMWSSAAAAASPRSYTVSSPAQANLVKLPRSNGGNVMRGSCRIRPTTAATPPSSRRSLVNAPHLERRTPLANAVIAGNAFDTARLAAHTRATRCANSRPAGWPTTTPTICSALPPPGAAEGFLDVIGTDVISRRSTRLLLRRLHAKRSLKTQAWLASGLRFIECICCRGRARVVLRPHFCENPFAQPESAPVFA